MYKDDVAYVHASLVHIEMILRWEAMQHMELLSLSMKMSVCQINPEMNQFIINLLHYANMSLGVLCVQEQLSIVMLNSWYSYYVKWMKLQ